MKLVVLSNLFVVAAAKCVCKSCLDDVLCAPPQCQRCGPKQAACKQGFSGCYTDESESCNCDAPTWPTGKGCTDQGTKYVHYKALWDGGFCCQIPKAWVTDYHDSAGVRVEPFPYPYSTTSWGTACGLDPEAIKRFDPHATFSDGQCKDFPGYTQISWCNEQPNCWCSTSWANVSAQSSSSMTDGFASEQLV
eukprot:TRINITY_DN13812_c0_g4_i2.p1 TRINITY_DN13812_c0_g4~~TRINITY_DN13812_c0_g4_i2.p1  ORF type:complete len:192 (-),score=19.41 TRINITY_DN13812_c0_g4_i2:124-699(-)